MFGFGHWEPLIILLIALIIFGAGKLPEIGNAIRNFKTGVAEVETEIKEEPKKIEAGQVSSLVIEQKLV